MYLVNPDNRELNIYTLLNEYEDILLETGILTRLDKKFDSDNNLVDSAPMPSAIMRLAKKEEARESSSKPLSTRLEKIAYMDAEKPSTKVTINLGDTNACPPDKEINPKTGRCIKKCAPDEIRNEKGRCVKNKTRKAQNKGRDVSRTRSRTRSRSRSSQQQAKPISRSSSNPFGLDPAARAKTNAMMSKHLKI
jgi:hypothetical protein